MEVFFYQAECGDAARISFKGNDNRNHNIFIDSGYDTTYDHILYDVIKGLIGKQSIDLWLVSHIHDDHIGGIISYLEAVERGEYTDIVKEWFYNPPRFYDSNKAVSSIQNVSEIASIGQGDRLFHYLKQHNKLKPNDITSETIPADIFGLKIFILSPSTKKLEKLRKKYSVLGKMLERNEIYSISEAVKAKGYDYHIKLEDFNLGAWTQDGSVENGSSISVLTDFNGKKILWLADAHPRDVVKSLKEMGFSEKNKLKCDWVKVAHHGSKGNNSNELYALIECENYLISGNGENQNYLPTKDSLARIIRNANRDLSSHYKIYFTYDNKVLRSIFDSDPDNIFEKWNFEIDFLSKKFYRFDL
jgi:beta-lactamase superfamily II metal-dependent hydrolase